MMVIQLSILTLNIWGIPVVSKDRTVRVQAIAEELAKGDYDVVSLQEVWSIHDYEYIKEKTNLVLPFTYYFHSGVAGSGLCILSKHQIVTTLFHSWSVNGYVHRITHGDWFGGKGVGLCKIMVAGHPVNIYIAHLHAEYDRLSDDYKSHRVIQAFDTAQFIENTRGDSILQVLAGDLNTEPGDLAAKGDLAYRILLGSSKMHETYQLKFGTFGTNECADNTYTSNDAKENAPQGKRIDYIWYRSGDNYESSVIDYKLPLSKLIPEHSISYSDHEGVNAKIIVKPIVKSTAEACSKNDDGCDAYELSLNLKECIKVCDEKLHRLETQKLIYYLMAMGSFMLLLFVIDIITPPYGFQLIYTSFKIFLSILIAFFMVMATFWNAIESNGILAGKLAMDITLVNALNIADPCKF